MYGKAITEVRTEHLEALLKSVYKEQLVCPLTAQTVALAGFLGIRDRIEFLYGLEKPAVTAVLVAVIAERRAPKRPNT